MKKLTRSVNNKMVCGVCGGIAEYFELDPTVVRLVWAGASLFFQIGILLYIIAVFIIPADDSGIIDV